MGDLATAVHGDGPALLLVHGAGGSVQANYGPVLRHLSPHFTLVAPDLPGSGRSPVASGPLDLDALADDVVAAAVAAGHETFHVCGYSMGSAIAATAAVRHPGRVRGLVLSAPFARLDAPARALVGRWRSLLDDGRAELARFVFPVMCGEKLLAGLSPSEREGFTELLALTVPPGAASHVDLLPRIDLSSALPRIDRPTLVIGATGDRLLTSGLAEEVAGLVPGARYAEIDSGHAIALEAAARWAELIREFLVAVPSAAGAPAPCAGGPPRRS